MAPTVEAFREEALDRPIRLRGWVLRSRSSGGILFMLVRDRTGVVQVTARKDVIGSETFDRVEHVQIEGLVSVEGVVKTDSRAPGGREVRATAIDVIDAGEPFPIFQEQTEEFRLDKRHLVIRSQEHVATFRVKAELLRAFREFLANENVLEMTPPILTGNPAEGGADAFQIDYFGKPGYLSQSAQLYLEALIAPHERVYALTPTFRAEKSRTPRHITEFWMLEIELAWVGLDELMDFIERMVIFGVQALADRCASELSVVGRDPAELRAVQAPFARTPYRSAIDRLARQGFPVSFGSDLGTAEERALTIEERAPIFVTHFPGKIKAFYMRQDPEDPELVQAADLLAPEGYGEIVGASVRETDIPRLVERLRASGANPEEYEWYLDLRRHGNVPHAGFGLGVERVLRWVLRREHIRETTPFPRTPARHTP